MLTQIKTTAGPFLYETIFEWVEYQAKLTLVTPLKGGRSQVPPNGRRKNVFPERQPVIPDCVQCFQGALVNLMDSYVLIYWILPTFTLHEKVQESSSSRKVN